MRFRTCIRGLLVVAIGVLALGTGTGVAQADPESEPDPMGPTLDQLVTINAPSPFTNPVDLGRPLQPNWDGTGMYCQNLFIKCR